MSTILFKFFTLSVFLSIVFFPLLYFTTEAPHIAAVEPRINDRSMCGETNRHLSLSFATLVGGQLTPNCATKIRWLIIQDCWWSKVKFLTPVCYEGYNLINSYCNANPVKWNNIWTCQDTHLRLNDIREMSSCIENWTI